MAEHSIRSCLLRAESGTGRQLDSVGTDHRATLSLGTGLPDPGRGRNCGRGCAKRAGLVAAGGNTARDRDESQQYGEPGIEQR